MMNQKSTEQDRIKNAAAVSCRYSMHTMSFCVKLTRWGAKVVRDKLVAYCEAEGLRYYEHKNEWADTKELIFPGFLAYGLNSVKVKAISKGKGGIYFLQIKVNPRMMFHKDAHPFVYIADADDIRKSLDPGRFGHDRYQWYTEGILLYPEDRLLRKYPFRVEAGGRGIHAACQERVMPSSHNKKRGIRQNTGKVDTAPEFIYRVLWLL